MNKLPNWLLPLKLPMPATLGNVNIYLIKGPTGNALVDTGMNDVTSIRSLTKQLDEHGLALRDIETIICTHHHADHAGLGKTFLEAGAETMMSSKDAASLRDFFDHPELDRERASFFGLHEVPADFAGRVTPMFPFFRGLAQKFEPSIELEDNQEIILGGILFKVLVTPGHTAGHICLTHGEDLLFTGDCITGGNATHISMRQDVIGTDPLMGFLASLKKLAELEPGIALPGHGLPIDNLKARVEYIINHHQKRLDHAEGLLTKEPITAFDLASKTMGPRPKPLARWLAMSQTLAYLEHLEALGRCLKIETEKGLKYRKQP